MADFFWFSDEQWARIKPLLPQDTRGIPRVDDQRVLSGIVHALKSGPFKQGLALLTTAQPALKPFVGLASSIVEAVASRNKNRQIYNFKLGLDFDVSQTSAKIREGSFIVVQGDASDWSWSEVE